MAQPPPLFLSPEDIKPLDSLRRQLLQLTNDIARLHTTVAQSNPLPPWSSLQATSAILSAKIKTITDLLSTHSGLLNRTVVYPATNWPGRTEEQALTSLIRKKLEPLVEAWTEDARATEATLTVPINEEEELLQFANEHFKARFVKFAQEETNVNYTAEEVERGIATINTGLRRQLYEDEDESEEDDDENEDDKHRTKKPNVAPVEVKRIPNPKDKSLEAISRFATSGWELDPVRKR